MPHSFLGARLGEELLDPLLTISTKEGKLDPPLTVSIAEASD